MIGHLYLPQFAFIRNYCRRALVILMLSFVVASTAVVMQDAQTAKAALHSATIVREDRRPDRERPVSGSPGSSSTSSRNSSSSKARPRLVRR